MKHQIHRTAAEVRKDRSSTLALGLFLSAVALLVFVNRGTPAHAAEPDTKPPTRSTTHA